MGKGDAKAGGFNFFGAEGAYGVPRTASTKREAQSSHLTAPCATLLLHQVTSLASFRVFLFSPSPARSARGLLHFVGVGKELGAGCPKVRAVHIDVGGRADGFRLPCVWHQ